MKIKTAKKTGKRDKAIKAYLNAIKLKPNDAGILNEVVDAHARFGRHKEAIQLCDEALKNTPRHGLITPLNGRSLIGKAYLNELGETPKAIEPVIKVLSVFPKDETALAALEKIAGKERAVAIRKAVEDNILDPQNPRPSARVTRQNEAQIRKSAPWEDPWGQNERSAPPLGRKEPWKLKPTKNNSNNSK